MTAPLAESFYELSKWGLIYRQGLRRGLDDDELATMTYADWFNTDAVGFTTRVEFETAYYSQIATALEAVT